MSARPLTLVVAAAPVFASQARARTPETPLPETSVRYRLGLLARGPAWTPERTPHTDSIQAGPAVRAGQFTPHVLHWWTAWGTIPGQ